MVPGMNLQVVHLSTSSVGGAGVAAARLHNELLNRNIKSYFFSISADGVGEILNARLLSRSRIETILGKFSAALNLLVSGKAYFTLFSKSADDLFTQLKDFNPEETIIHVHNWFNLTDLNSLLVLQRMGFKLVFTLHDMRLMTGGCHVSLSCDNFTAKCEKCPNLAFPMNRLTKPMLKSQIRLEEIYAKAMFICPSMWIMEQALMSESMRSAKLVHVHNYVDASSPLEFKIRKPGKHRVGVASMSNHSYFKGDDLVLGLLEYQNSDSSKFEIIRMQDFPQTDSGKQEFWQTVDTLLVPSRFDNSPNVIHEAKINGVKVVASDVGGIRELLNIDFDVAITPDQLNLNHIIQILENFSDKDSSSKTAESIRNSYLSLVANPVEKILSIYLSLITP